MEAIRTVVEPKDNKILLTLPDDFHESLVEVIILPFTKPDNEKINPLKAGKNNKKNKIQKLLLQAPTMSDEDYNLYLEKRNHFNQWNQSV